MSDELGGLRETLFMRVSLTKAQHLLARLRDDGFIVSRDGSMINVAPAGKLTDDRRALIRELKPHVLTALVLEKL